MKVRTLAQIEAIFNEIQQLGQLLPSVEYLRLEEPLPTRTEDQKECLDPQIFIRIDNDTVTLER
jgi:hypothetical protein